MGRPRKDQTETAQENRGTKRKRCKVEESQKAQPKKVKPQVQPKKMNPQKPEVEEPRLTQQRPKAAKDKTAEMEPKEPHPRQDAKKATKKQVSQTDLKQQQRSIEKESEKHIEQSVRAEPGLPKQLAQVANEKTTEKNKSRKQDHRTNDEVNKLMEKAELTAKKRLESSDNPWNDKRPQLPQPQVHKTMEAATAVHLHAQAEDQRKAAEAKQEAEQAQPRAEAKQDLREAAAEAAARQASEEAEEEERWRTLARNEVKAQMAPFQEKHKAELAEAEEKKKEAAAKKAQAAGEEVKQKGIQKPKGIIVPPKPRSQASRANLERREGERIKHLLQQQMCLQAEAWAAVEIATEKHLQLKSMFVDSISRDKENMVLRQEVMLLQASKEDWL